MALVLLIDDDDQFRSMARAALERAGYRVIAAKDGPAGIMEYKRFRPEVVITDLVMEGMDGAATMEVLRQVNPVAQVIATSGRAYNDVMLSMAKRLGASAVLPKPFKNARLIAEVDRCVEAAGGTPPTRH